MAGIRNIATARDSVGHPYARTDGLSLLERLQVHYPHIPVIIMTAHSDLDSAVSAYQAGAFEYLPKPFDIDEAISLVERALTHATEQSPAPAQEAQVKTPEIIGEAPAMQEVFRAIGRLSRSSISVLINGQSGTGKELVAGALHKHSPRKDKPFIALNMAAIPKDLIESELFGHEKVPSLAQPMCAKVASNKQTVARSF